MPFEKKKMKKNKNGKRKNETAADDRSITHSFAKVSSSKFTISRQDFCLLFFVIKNTKCPSKKARKREGRPASNSRIWAYNETRIRMYISYHAFLIKLGLYIEPRIEVDAIPGEKKMDSILDMFKTIVQKLSKTIGKKRPLGWRANKKNASDTIHQNVDL